MILYIIASRIFLSPHTKDAINKIEMVQRRAARYVTNRYRNTSSVTSMLGDLEWDTLEIRRKKQDMSECSSTPKYFDEASDVSLCPLRM
jgi:uncharacterized protein (UPF0305 family)